MDLQYYYFISNGHGASVNFVRVRCKLLATWLYSVALSNGHAEGVSLLLTLLHTRPDS